MRKRKRLAVAFAYLMLETAALFGAPVRAEDVEKMTRALQRTQVVRVARRDEDGEPPRDDAL